jgi:hypothetical protein
MLTFSVPVAVIFTIIGAFKSPTWIGLAVLILLYPSILKRFLPRNSIIAIPLIGFLLAKSIPQLPLQWLYLSVGALLVGFLYKNRVLCFAKPKIKALETSKFLDTLPKDGVLAEGLIAYFIAHNSKKRVVVIPHAPEFGDAVYQTKLSIEHFDLNYAVISDLWKTEEHLGYPAIRYIKLFKLIKTIQEDGDTYFIYEIPTD